MALPRSVRKSQDEEQEGNPAGGNKQRGPRDGQSVTQLVLTDPPDMLSLQPL